MVSRSTRASPLVVLLGAIFLFATNVFAVQAVLGVDLGTEYIKAALVKPGIPLDIVLTKDSRRKEIAAVTFKPSKNGPQDGHYPERLYGSDSVALTARFPGEVFPNLKALLGLPADHPTVREYAARHPALQLQPHTTRNTAAFKTNTLVSTEEPWTVEELLAMQFQSIQKNAELAAGDGSTVRSIVLTVPPFYTTDEKRAVQSAAELAGLKVLSLISDGLAVGLNFATSRQFPSINEGAKPECHMVFDMGAGSTKATIMKFQSRSIKDIGKFNKTVQEVQVMGTGWDRTLGGDALNYLIVDDMVSKFLDTNGAKKISATAEGVRRHARAIAKLTKEAERVRHVLSANQNTGASFEGLYEDVDFKYKITRAEFEALAESNAERVGTVIQGALKMSGMEIADLDSVILHGGASRTPFVQKALEKALGSADKLRSNVNSDEAAVFGAGFRAAELSPSFRVKDIRIMEGSNYPIGLKWVHTEAYDQIQRLWTPISPLGGSTKEITIAEENDFTGTFYQEVSGKLQETRSFTTKNLTASIASLKEKYPSCVESGVQFRLGVRLSGENGEIRISKAAVECEAEVKEGLIDGVKNLFGFGKKDQDPLKGDSAEPETETEKVEAAAEESSTTSSSSDSVPSDAQTTGSTEEIKANTKKIETVSIAVEYVVGKLGIPELSKEQMAKSKDRLKAFAASDKARFQREEALNQLEGYTYKVRDFIDDDAFIAVSTAAERTKLSEKSAEISEWLYDDGADATKDQLKARLKELQGLALPIRKRIEELELRPGHIEKLNKALDQASQFIDTTVKQIKEYEDFQASSSAASSASTKTQSSQASQETPSTEEQEAPVEAAKDSETTQNNGPVEPLFKREDLVDIEALYKSTQEWLKEHVSKQEKLAATVDPVLRIQDLTSKREKIEKLARDLALKGARNVKKAPKATGKKKSSTKTASAEQPKHTLEDKVFTQDEIEEMIKNMSPEDWEKMRQQEAEIKKKLEEQRKHDEL